MLYGQVGEKRLTPSRRASQPNAAEPTAPVSVKQSAASKTLDLDPARDRHRSISAAERGDEGGDPGDDLGA